MVRVGTKTCASVSYLTLRSFSQAKVSEGFLLKTVKLHSLKNRTKVNF